MNGGVLDEEECLCNCSSAIDYSGEECEGVYSSYSGITLEVVPKGGLNHPCDSGGGVKYI